MINYVRGKTWISSTFARETLFELSDGKKTDNCMSIVFTPGFIFTIIHVDEFTEMDLEAFKDLEYLRAFRRTLEQDLNVSPPFIDITLTLAQLAQAAIPITILGSSLESIARLDFKQSMLNKLSKKPWIAQHRAF